MIRLWSNIIISTLVLLMISCEHKEIGSPGRENHEVTIRFEWDHASGASPEGMTVYFYPESEYGEIWRFDLAGREGGTVEVPTGDYRIEAFNTDVPRIRFTGTDSFDSLKAEILKSADGKDISSTGILYSGIISHLEVSRCGVKYINSDGDMKDCCKSVIRIYPDSLTTYYDVWIKNVKGAESVIKVEVFLSGVASEMMIASSTPTGDPATLAFPMDVNENHSLFRGSGYAFSPLQKDGRSYLSIAVTFSTGKTICRKLDVTSQVMNSPFKRSVIIVIDGLSIPSPTDPDYPDEDIGGIDVDVDGWMTIETDIVTA